MTVPVLSAAKWLAEHSGWTLSNLEIQKILYLAHMFYMGRHDGEPLVGGVFEAWDYGPVHPDLYHRAKIFGSDPVENVFHEQPNLTDGREQEILEEAYAQLGDLGPGRLVNATHRTGGAWDRNYSRGVRHSIIPNEDIIEEYQNLDN